MIPLGILATTAAGGGGGSYELISSTVLGSTTSSIVFSSIPGTYKHLQLRGLFRSAAPYDLDGVVLKVNALTSGNYAYHELRGNGSSVSSAAATNTIGSVFDYGAAANQTTGIFTPVIIDVLDYASTAKYKTIRNLVGTTGSSGTHVALTSIAAFSTAAVTSLTITTGNSANMVVGTRFSLYGIKG